MDLHWRTARMRKWIAIGERENLSQKQLAHRAGVTTRTIRRWRIAVRALEHSDPFIRVAEELLDPADGSTKLPVVEIPPAPPLERAFVDLFAPARSYPNPIEIVLSGERRRLVIDGSIDVEALARVIAAVERC